MSGFNCSRSTFFHATCFDFAGVLIAVLHPLLAESTSIENVANAGLPKGNLITSRQTVRECSLSLTPPFLGETMVQGTSRVTCRLRAKCPEPSSPPGKAASRIDCIHVQFAAK